MARPVFSPEECHLVRRESPLSPLFSWNATFEPHVCSPSSSFGRVFRKRHTIWPLRAPCPTCSLDSSQDQPLSLVAQILDTVRTDQSGTVSLNQQFPSLVMTYITQCVRTTHSMLWHQTIQHFCQNRCGSAKRRPEATAGRGRGVNCFISPTRFPTKKS